MIIASTTNIILPPGNDGAVIIAAKIALIGAILAALITGLAILMGAGITAVVSWQLKSLELNKQLPGWKEIARENDWIPKGECQWNSVQAVGRDKSGKKIKVKINLLSSEYRWVYGSSTVPELGEKKDLAELIRDLDLSTNSRGIVGIGMASEEGDLSGQSALAELRTDTLMQLIKHELKPTVPVVGLSLGRFNEKSSKSNPELTSTQRRVVVAEILEEEEGVNLEDAIFDALVDAKNSSPPIPFDVEKYAEHKLTDRGFKRL